MASPGEAPPPAPASIEGAAAASSPSEFFLIAGVVGVALRCVVNPKWPSEALLGAAAEAYSAHFPASEVPECNVIFHRSRREFLVAGVPLGECCASGDELELGVTLPAQNNTQDEVTPSVAASSVSGLESEAGTSEFCVLFHKLPLGFTMKRGHDSSTEVGAIYPKSAATHFQRLASGITIVSIAGTPLREMGLRKVHELIKNAELPLEIRFRGPELLNSPTLTPEAAEQKAQVPPSRLPAPSSTTPTRSQQEGKRRGSFDRRSVRSSGSNGSRNSRGSGRGKKGSAQRNNTQRNGKTQNQSELTVETNVSNQHNGPEQHENDLSETELIAHIEELKIALLRKHEEAKQIARQLELCTEKLVAIRSNGETEAPPPQQQAKHNGHAPRLRRNGATPTNVRLTPEVLEAMDQKSGLPRRGTGAYTSSNVSSISGYSGRSTPAPRTAGMRSGRSARAAALANADNVSVSSYTSQSSNTSGRGGSRSPRSAALRNLNKRYNYMPQKYAASATGATEPGATSLSSRGAVMSRARISRDSFITRSESPGVGYYDVKVKDRVKGGEIGDSDRSLPWS